MDLIIPGIGILLTLLFGLIAWTANGFVATIGAVRKDLAAHVDECNKVPKILILEKIEHIRAELVAHTEAEGETLRRIEAKVDK